MISFTIVLSAVPVNSIFSPTFNVSLVLFNLNVISCTSGVLSITVILHTAYNSPFDAVMVVVPDFIAFTSPLFVMLATLLLLLFHVKFFSFFPSIVPDNSTFSPTFNVSFVLL